MQGPSAEIPGASNSASRLPTLNTTSALAFPITAERTALDNCAVLVRTKCIPNNESKGGFSLTALASEKRECESSRVKDAHASVL